MRRLEDDRIALVACAVQRHFSEQIAAAGAAQHYLLAIPPETAKPDLAPEHDEHRPHGITLAEYCRAFVIFEKLRSIAEDSRKAFKEMGLLVRHAPNLFLATSGWCSGPGLLEILYTLEQLRPPKPARQH